MSWWVVVSQWPLCDTGNTLISAPLEETPNLFRQKPGGQWRIETAELGINLPSSERWWMITNPGGRRWIISDLCVMNTVFCRLINFLNMFPKVLFLLANMNRPQKLPRPWPRPLDHQLQWPTCATSADFWHSYTQGKFKFELNCGHQFWIGC